jgi:probable selenium-dependent hydroxylase accessory protein YqeC
VHAVAPLVDVLAARSGIVCAVGAGGKKTTLYHLGSTHPGRVGLTTTVPHAPFSRALGARVVIAEPEAIVTAVVEAASSARLVAFALPPVKRARYGGLPPGLIVEIQRAAAFDVVYVKGDGARMRWIKAPADGEPVIPDATRTVLPIVSARAIGAPLSDEVAHRPERLAQVTGARPGEPITPVHVARLLAHERGSLKDIGDATVVPVINMVDDAERETAALEAARIALELTDRFDRVALTSNARSDRRVRVVTR